MTIFYTPPAPKHLLFIFFIMALFAVKGLAGQNNLPVAIVSPTAQSVCSGNNITTIVITGTGTIYNWTRDNTATVTGIAADGSGNISGALTNTTPSPVTVTFTIIPIDGANTGNPITATVLVNPVPAVNPVSNQTVCNNGVVNTISFSGPVNGSGFIWTNNNTSIGLAANGSDSLPSFMAVNTSSSPATATITVTPVAGVQGVAPPANWQYAKRYVVTENADSTLNNYQLRMVINTQQLIGAGMMNADGSDIRFGYNNGSILLNYWIESGINTSSTVIWVKIDTLPAGSSKDIFMYYGNAAAPPASIIQGTFYGNGQSATDSVATGQAGGVSNSQRGFRFSPKEDILVTHFGKREPSGSTREITLFNVSKQAILQQTAVSGPAAQYSYAPILSPVWLMKDSMYILTIYQDALNGSYYFGPSTQIGEHLTYYDMRYCNGCFQNTFPTNTLAGYHYGYPDFWYFTKSNITPAPTYTEAAAVACTGTPVTFTITVNPIPVITTVTTSPCATDTGSIFIQATGPGVLEYSIDNGAAWSVNPVFSGLTGGSYPVSVRSQSFPACIVNWPGSVFLNTNTFLLPLSEGFESTTFPPSGWSVINPDNNITWQRTTLAAATGAASARINAYNYVSRGQRDILVAPRVRTTGSAILRIGFDVAYARYSALDRDSLEVVYSTDCGVTWLPTSYRKAQLELATNGGGIVTGSFTPVSSQWRRETVDINLCGAVPSVLVGFRFINNNGQNCYIDNVSLTAAADTVAPVITSCAAPVTVNCAADIPAVNTSSITATDNCPVVTITHRGDVISNQTCTNRYTISRTYRAMDQAGNFTECIQTITVNDQTAPVINNCPAAVTVSCAASVPAPNTSLVAATDNCGGNVTISHVSDIISNQTCANRYTITRTYRAADACGNFSECTQLITVNDQEAPVILCPANITIAALPGRCDAVVNYAASATDNCGVVNITGVPASGTAFKTGTTAVNIMATDACGNTSVCSFTITLLDAQMPLITTQPVNRSICEGANTSFTVTATTSPNAGGTLTYQWQQWNGSTWINIPGAITSLFSINNATLSQNNNRYRVAISGLCTVVYSPAVSLFVNPLPTVSLAANPLSSLLPAKQTTITATVNLPGGRFLWSRNGSLLNVTGPVLGPLTVDGTGSYQLAYTTVNGCTTTSSLLTIDATPSDNLWIYPNPSNGQFNVRFYNQTGETVTVIVYDMYGRQVHNQKLLTGTAYSNINIRLNSTVASGAYLVKVISESKKELAVKKIFVKN